MKVDLTRWQNLENKSCSLTSSNTPSLNKAEEGRRDPQLFDLLYIRFPWASPFQKMDLPKQINGSVMWQILVRMTTVLAKLCFKMLRPVCHSSFLIKNFRRLLSWHSVLLISDSDEIKYLTRIPLHVPSWMEAEAAKPCVPQESLR